MNRQQLQQQQQTQQQQHQIQQQQQISQQRISRVEQRVTRQVTSQQQGEKVLPPKKDPQFSASANKILKSKINIKQLFLKCFK